MGVGLAPAAHAQIRHGIGGGVGLTPSIELRGTYTDNFFYQADDTEEATGLLIKPAVKLDTASGPNELTLDLHGTIAQFDLPGTADDYRDGSASIRFDRTAAQRHRFDAQAAFERGHDPFGTVRTEGSGNLESELDLWHNTSGAVTYRVGAQGARMNVDLGVRASAREYVTNEAQTAPLNNDQLAGELTAFYNLSPKTALLANFTRTDIDFETRFPGGPSRDARDTMMRVGARWNATGNTSGDIRVGVLERQSESTGDRVSRNATWQVGLSWSPLFRTTIRLESRRLNAESYLSEAVVIDQKYNSISLEQDLSSRFRAFVTGSVTDVDYQPDARHDEILRLDLGLEYQASSHLTVIGGGGYRQRDTADRDYSIGSAFAGLRYYP